MLIFDVLYNYLQKSGHSQKILVILDLIRNLVLSGYDCMRQSASKTSREEDDAMAKRAVSPSEGSITIGQAAKLADLIIARLRKSELPVGPTQHVLENEGRDIVDAFEADLRCRVMARLRSFEHHILERKTFHPESFLGRGWNVDERVGRCSRVILDAKGIVGKDYLHQGEPYTDGERYLKRIKVATGDDLLDAEDFLALWTNRDHFTLRWLYFTKGITELWFWGTILRSPDGICAVLGLYRNDDDGTWRWQHCWVANMSCYADNPVAVLDNNRPATPEA